MQPTSSHSSAASFGLALLATVFVAACGLAAEVNRDRIDLSGSGGNSSGGGPATSTTSTSQATTSGQGGAAECYWDEDCPNGPNTCLKRRCIDEQCGFDKVSYGSLCLDKQDPSAQVCNGDGSCVECITKAQCTGNDLCSDNSCVKSQCRNGTVDGDETDTDCGGASCAPCGNGNTCEKATDCISRYCASTGGAGGGPPAPGVCSACNDHQHCEGGQYCNAQTTSCETKLAQSATCSENEACNGGLCVDGYCCDEICDQTCNSCKLVGSEGVCSKLVAETDPDAECAPDSCSGSSACFPGTLLLNEFVSTPSVDEFVEIHNTATETVTLHDVWLADFASYHKLTTSSAAPGANDFLLRFPANTTIAGKAYVVVSLESATSFHAAYGSPPDYDLDPNDNGAPSMLGQIGASAGLANAPEMIVLFHWDGVSPLVGDLDYVVYGDTSEAMDKTGLTVNNQTYKSDTSANAQSPAAKPGAGESAIRCDPSEGLENKVGGNGRLGHNETSEDLASTWSLSLTPSPGTSNTCP